MIDNITPMYDRIFFSFVENLSNTNFLPKTKSGIFLTDNYDFSEAHSPKWGRVLRCGPDVSDEIRNSKFILIEPGKWTIRTTYKDEHFWHTEENFVMAVTDDEDSTYRY